MRAMTIFRRHWMPSVIVNDSVLYHSESRCATPMVNSVCGILDVICDRWPRFSDLAQFTSGLQIGIDLFLTEPIQGA